MCFQTPDIDVEGLVGLQAAKAQVHTDRQTERDRQMGGHRVSLRPHFHCKWPGPDSKTCLLVIGNHRVLLHNLTADITVPGRGRDSRHRRGYHSPVVADQADQCAPAVNDTMYNSVTDVKHNEEIRK